MSLILFMHHGEQQVDRLSYVPTIAIELKVSGFQHVPVLSLLCVTDFLPVELG